MKIMSRKVNVVVVTYNQAEFIGKCLDSVLNQETSYDYQVVLVDDGSSDGTLEICHNYAKLNPAKIKLISHGINRGLSAAYSTAFMNCDGDFISICEGDDWWISTTKVQRQADFLVENAQYQAVHTATVLGSDRQTLSDNIFTSTAESAVRTQIVCSCIPHTSSLMFRNNWPKDYCFSFDATVNLLDGVFSSLNATYGGTGFISDVYVYYRVHAASLWTPLSKIRAGIWSLYSHIYSYKLLLIVSPENVYVTDVALERVVATCKGLLKYAVLTRDIDTLYIVGQYLHELLCYSHRDFKNGRLYLICTRMVTLMSHRFVGTPPQWSIPPLQSADVSGDIRPKSV